MPAITPLGKYKLKKNFPYFGLSTGDQVTADTISTTEKELVLGEHDKEYVRFRVPNGGALFFKLEDVEPA